MMPLRLQQFLSTLFIMLPTLLNFINRCPKENFCSQYFFSPIWSRLALDFIPKTLMKQQFVITHHDTQIIQLHNIDIPTQQIKPIGKRTINEVTIAQFKLNLSYESWYKVFNDEDLDSSFNSFLNTYLRIYYNSFPPKKSLHKQ
jgi:hypothetical protein